MSKLFSVLRLRDVEFKNRIFVSPMCQYSSVDGMPNDWHFVHLGNLIAAGEADAVFLARVMLRDPYWALDAAKVLQVDVAYPRPYERAQG